MNILMVAAENGALPGGKVGGIGDVIRDIPRALAKLGHKIHVVTPGYQKFGRLPGAKRDSAVDVVFRGVGEHVELYKIPLPESDPNIHCWALEHPLFAPCGSGVIYCNDPNGTPFAADASKFALFSLAVAQAANEGAWGALDAIHLHDWHAAMVAVLAKFSPRYRQLGKKQLVYTIHNLSLQGIRPLSDDPSALFSWFPGLPVELRLVADPRYPNCINPMRAGINLCDKVQAVSPTYAREIQAPSDPETGYVGGEGLEDDLRCAGEEQRLIGILNGCEYPVSKPRPKGNFEQLLDGLEQQLLQWVAAEPTVGSDNLLALRNLDYWRRHYLDTENTSSADEFQSRMLVTSVGRLVAQKVHLLVTSMSDGRTVLDHLLDRLVGKGLMVILGSGSAELEQQIAAVMARNKQLIYLNGYSEELPQLLYKQGDLFLMPSSFEPCGISQMLAMREGQPCLVHHVGGLVDTVNHLENGFSFNGHSELAQVQHLVECFEQALTTYQNKPQEWQRICTNAASARFLWDDVAKEYVSKLYAR